MANISMEVIQDYFRLAIKSLRRRKVRSWLTMLGIVIGIASVVALVSISIGLNDAVEEQFEQFGSDKLFIAQAGAAGFSQGPPSSSFGEFVLTEDDADAVRSVDKVEFVSAMIFQAVPVKYRDETQFLLVTGIPPDKETEEIFESIQGFELAEGRSIEEGDTFEINIGHNLAKEKTFDKNIKLRDKVEIGGEEFKVIGIWSKIGNDQDDNTIVMPIDTFRELFDIENEVTIIMVQVEDGANILDVEEDIEEALRDEKDQDEGEETFAVFTSEDILRLINETFGLIQLVLIGIAGISILVGAVGIMNTMYTSVLERTKDVGVMKAIGAKNSDILKLFMFEAGFLGLVGGGIGVAIGLGLALAVELFAGTALFVPLAAYTGLDLIFGALLLSFLLGSVAGALPARTASKMKPADALRYE